MTKCAQMVQHLESVLGRAGLLYLVITVLFFTLLSLFSIYNLATRKPTRKDILLEIARRRRVSNADVKQHRRRPKFYIPGDEGGAAHLASDDADEQTDLDVLSEKYSDHIV